MRVRQTGVCVRQGGAALCRLLCTAPCLAVCTCMPAAVSRMLRGRLCLLRVVRIFIEKRNFNIFILLFVIFIISAYIYIANRYMRPVVWFKGVEYLGCMLNLNTFAYEKMDARSFGCGSSAARRMYERYAGGGLFRSGKNVVRPLCNG